jgi:glycosyltransferase involved in cell wall biosynthesis
MPPARIPWPEEEVMHVAFVTVGDTSRLTGGYLYNARVLAALRERGVAVDEIVPCGASPEEQEEAAPRLGSLLDPRRFDVVVVDALARIVCAPHLDRWRRERPVVAMVHELPSVAAPKARLEREYEEPLLRADRLISVSEHARSILHNRGVPAARIRVVPPGFDRLPKRGGDKPPVRGTAVRALCVAQWIPRKGILDLVRAWTLHERPGVALELVGETDVDPVYAASVRAAVADASITVSGPVDDAALGAAYASADLFVLPSRYEGYGVVYAEALVHGLPVVACNVGPVPELVGEEAALLVPPGDVEALSGALDLLLEDAALRDRMSAAALRRAEELPRWRDTTVGFLRVLRGVEVEWSRPKDLRGPV